MSHVRCWCHSGAGVSAELIVVLRTSTDQGGMVAGGYNMELRIALEMSQLQQLEELNRQRQRSLSER